MLSQITQLLFVATSSDTFTWFKQLVIHYIAEPTNYKALSSTNEYLALALMLTLVIMLGLINNALLNLRIPLSCLADEALLLPENPMSRIQVYRRSMKINHVVFPLR